MFKSPRRNKHWWDLLLFAVLLILLYKVIDNIAPIAHALMSFVGILRPFILGLVLAFLLYTPSLFLENRFRRAKNKFLRKRARGLSITVSYVSFFALLTVFVAFMVPILTDSVTNLVSALPTYYQRIVEFYDNSRLKDMLAGIVNFETYIDDFYKWGLSLLTVENLTASLGRLISLTSSMLSVILSVVVSIYMLAGREHLIAAIRRVFGLFLPERRLVTVGEYLRKTGNIFSGYVYGMLMDACIIGVYATVCLLILGVPNAPLFGVMMGVLNLIPYFGAMIGGVICFVVALLSRNIYIAIGVAVLICIGQQLDGNLIQPRILNQQVGVRPIYVLLAITVGGGLFGFWGIVLGVPVIAVIQMLLRDVLQIRNRQKAAVPDASGNTNTKEKQTP